VWSSPWGARESRPTWGTVPLPGDLHWDDKLSQCPALKIRAAHLQESQRAIGNQDSAFKWLTHKLTHSKTQHRGSGFTSAWAICEGD